MRPFVAHLDAHLMRDLRYGVRTLRRSPLFTTLVIVTLALGIGANTAVFSLIDLLVLRDLPVRDPAQLVQFTWTYPGDPPLNLFSIEHYEHYRDHNTVFSEIFGTGSAARLRGRTSGGPPEPLRVECVTANFFDALGVSVGAGRSLTEADGRASAPPAAVVSWRYATDRFARASEIVGTSLVLLEDVPATVVGVLDHPFAGLALGYTPEVWIPTAVCERKGRPGLALMARLKPGVSIDRARAEMRVLDRPRVESFALRDPQWRQVVLDVSPARTGFATPLHHQFLSPLSVLMAVLAAVLLLACANVGGLLLARGAARQRELAVRVSLGAGRLRIVRQLLTESLLLAFVGGVLGTAGAYAGAGALGRIVTSGIRGPGVSPHLQITIDARSLAFATMTVLLTAVVFGLLPALAAFPSAPAVTLRESGTASAPRGRRLFANGLVVAQVALAVVSLSVSAHLVAHLSNLRGRDLGFDPASVLLVRLDTASPPSPPQLQERYRDLLGRLEALPGVRSATMSAMTPISGAAGSRFVSVEGFEEPTDARRRLLLNVVAPRFFETLRTPLIAGRDFQFDDATGPRVVIVNEAMVRRYLFGRDPLGTRIRLEGDADPHEIVGVVADAKYLDVRLPAPPAMYLHYFQQRGGPPELALRTGVPPASIVENVRRIAGDVLGPVRLTNTTTLAEQVDASIVPERLIATVSGFLSGLGLLLAAVGVFGLLAYTVAQRTQEIGVRMALGATERAVAMNVVWTAFTLVIAGLLVGAPAAIWSTRVAGAMVGSPAEGAVVPVIAALIGTVVVSLVAAYVPARRASRVDPIVALRAE